MSNQKRLVLYTSPTGNGRQVPILLEELKLIYGPAIDYEIVLIDRKKGTQKEPWFLALNPNGKIPTLVDRAQENFAVFESSAILLYLVQTFDVDRRLSFDPATHPKDYSETMQWLFYVHGGLAIAYGQSVHFTELEEDVPYAKNRWLTELERHFGVLESRLSNRQYLAGPGVGTYSVADIKAMVWAGPKMLSRLGVGPIDKWPNVEAWLVRIEERPGISAAERVLQQ